MIFNTVWLPAISNQFKAMYESSESEKAVKKKTYVSIILEITVDKAGAIHQVEYLSLIDWNAYISINIPKA